VNVLTNLLAFVVAISVLVAIHEFGHYIVGRWCGMKVLRFSIGFGKPIWTIVAGKDRTEYCLSAIPLGGYVKFLDGRDGLVEEADKGRAFDHRPIPLRIAVLLAGPLFNFLFAVFAYWVLFVSGVPTMKPAIGEVLENSYAAEAGLQYGDRILQVDQRDAVDWETVLVSMLDTMVSDGHIEFRVESENGIRHTVTIDVGNDAARLTEPGLLFKGLGFYPWQPPAKVGSIAEGGAAAAASMEIGDRITEINGERIASFSDLQRMVAARPDEYIDITLVRDGELLDIVAKLDGVDTDGVRTGLLGIGLDQAGGDFWYVRKYGVVAAIGESLQQTWSTTAFTFRMFGKMLTGEVSIKNISGPINIAQYAGDSAAAGVNSFLRFLALVSISLGVINLLPIPVLDGGQIVYQIIEGLKGSPLSMRSQIVGQQIGIFALLLLMSYAFYNDLSRIFS